jgi:hypothetical protein
MTLATALGLCDALAGIVMLWSALRITSAAGWRTVAARWALFRRFVYGGTSIAFFGLGVGRIDGDYPVSVPEATFHAMVLVGVIVFPLMRAFGWISQDEFTAVDGTAEPPGAGRR